MLERRQRYQQLNELGIKAYQSGELEQALGHFREALRRAPANTGAALNKIQVLLQLMQKNRKSPEFGAECKETLEVLDGIPSIRPSRIVFASCVRSLPSSADQSPLAYADTDSAKGGERRWPCVDIWWRTVATAAKRRETMICAAGTIPTPIIRIPTPPASWSTTSSRAGCATACNWPAPIWRASIW